MKKVHANLKKKFFELKESYHIPTNYRRTMNIEPKNWGFKDMFFIWLFLFLAWMAISRVYNVIMMSSNPSIYMNIIFIFLIFIFLLIVIFRILMNRNLFIPYYKKPSF
ncbi:hypothetical protein HOE04_02060 [archaeon]|jgi:hypothetical protein|nr:hypothetical protein [archaeon]